MFHPAKTKVLSMGRRWGKSVLGGCLALPTAVAGGKVAWIAPTYKNTRPLWRTVEQAVAPLVRDGRAIVSKSEKTVTFEGGGFLALYSADNPTSILGEWFHLAVVDEAARVAEEVWTDTIQPTLADADGDAILISTPRGKNWFYKEWIKGQDKNSEIASWEAPTSANPSPQIQAAARKAERKVSSRTYRQEWLAKFLDDGGEVFRFLDRAATAQPQDEAISGHAYMMGVDWGKREDFTVLTIIDATTRELVKIDRFNEIDYERQIPRLIGLYKKFNPLSIIVEQNNVGIPLIEKLQRLSLPVQAFVTTNASKAILVEELQTALELETIKILKDELLINELEAFESERLPSGLIRYAAPSGMHDDIAMSLLFAHHGIAEMERGAHLDLQTVNSFDDSTYQSPSLPGY